MVTRWLSKLRRAMSSVFRNEREHSLRRDAQRMAMLGSWEYDASSGQFYGTREFYALFEMEGLTDKGLTLEQVFERVHPDDRALFQNYIGGPDLTCVQAVDFRIIRPGGNTRWLHSRFNKYGTSRCVGIVQDITRTQSLEDEVKLLNSGQLEATRQLKEAQAELESFITCNPDAIGFFNNDGTVRQVNAAFERLLGYAAEELKVEKLTEMPFARTVVQSDEELTALIQSGGIQSKEIDVLRLDGSILTGLISMTPFPDQEGFALIVKDVSELRETKDLLGRSEMLSMIGQLAAGVAHEIRNPLTSLKGFIRLIEPALQPRESRYLDIMKGELDRIELIVNEMLVLSKPQIMELALYPMDELLDYIIELLSTQAVMKSIEIDRFFEPVPPIECEQRRIKQVFVNLLKNAIESMEPNGIIKVSIERADEDHVRVVVSDQGKGMTQEQLSRLTEPFYTTKEKGNGLGLMMTASIIERHGGSIVFDSVVGVGTTVTVTLPIKQQKQELLSGRLLAH